MVKFPEKGFAPGCLPGIKKPALICQRFQPRDQRLSAGEIQMNADARAHDSFKLCQRLVLPVQIGDNRDTGDHAVPCCLQDAAVPLAVGIVVICIDDEVLWQT